MEEHAVITGDGRTLKVLERGDAAGRPVLVHNGTPNSRLLYDDSVASAQQRGIRLISYDRPGYGGSSPHPGRSVADCAQDVRAIAGALRIDRLGVWGVSGGGPHALACAALLADLVPAVGVLVTVEPPRIPKLQAVPSGTPALHDVADVVKVHTKLAASVLPARS